MISAVGGDGGLLGRQTDGSAAIQRQLNVVLSQQASGKVSNTYAGLAAVPGAGLRTSLDVRPAVAHVATWQANIDQASAKLDLTQSSLKQIADIAQDFYAKTNGINELGTSAAGSVAAQARQALQQVAQLLNTQDGSGNYLFAGQDTGTAPVPDTSPDAVGAAVLASDTDPAPFSSTLGGALPHVEVGPGQTVNVGVRANQNTLAVSAAPTTGSYARDILRALASLAGLTGDASDAAVATDSHSRLGSAIAALADESGALGGVQASLVTRKAALGATATAFNRQVSDAEDVDLAATLTRVQSLQTQLQASYQITATLKGLSLASYL